MSLIGLLVAVLVICVVLWAVKALLSAFGVGDPIRTVVYVIIVILVLFMLLSALGFNTNFRLR